MAIRPLNRHVVRPVHNRMPVLLHDDEWDRWLHGSIEDVIEFQTRCFPDELTGIERTADPGFGEAHRGDRKPPELEIVLEVIGRYAQRTRGECLCCFSWSVA